MRKYDKPYEKNFPEIYKKDILFRHKKYQAKISR